MLEENGLRVCLVGRLMPARLQALLWSPRSCPDPRRLHGQPGQPIFVPVGPSRSACSFHLRAGSSSRAVQVRDARCVFGVVATAEEEGRLRLRFTPHLRHGKPSLQRHVARDPDGQLRWAVEPCEKVEEFDALRFELTVAADESVVLGGSFEQPGTPGHCFFVWGDGRPRQHLLVLRASRAQAGPATDEAAPLATPLALQATRPARGNLP